MRRRISFVSLLSILALVATSCGGGGSSGAAKRTVLVDYNQDEFSAIYIGYFPTSVTVRPGDTVHFKQAWNGEPHSVTMGTLVDTALGIINPLLQKYPNGQGAPPEANQTFDQAFKDLPFLIGDKNVVSQSAAQPCYLDSGVPSQDPAKACPKRPQPAFDGRQSYYSSGFIQYAGNQGNTFDVKLADKIKPGTYGFYCNFHGPSMQGKIVVKPKGSTIPSEATQQRRARADGNRASAPAKKALDRALTGPWDIVKAAKAAGFPLPPDDVLSKIRGSYFSGYGSQEAQDSLITEFLPKTIHAKVGEKVTWLYVGKHTVSFDVPRYFPLLVVKKDGTIAVDPRPVKPIGGSGFPENMPDNAPNPYIVDGGTWDGHGFRSSGLNPDTQSDDQITGFSIAFSKAGTYQYACLIHPRMVGTVVVG